MAEINVGIILKLRPVVCFGGYVLRPFWAHWTLSLFQSGLSKLSVKLAIINKIISYVVACDRLLLDQDDGQLSWPTHLSTS